MVILQKLEKYLIINIVKLQIGLFIIYYAMSRQVDIPVSFIGVKQGVPQSKGLCDLKDRN